MAKLSFTSENVPTPEEFQQMLTEAMAESNPVDELLELAHELQEYERKYEMRSSEFFERFQRGELGDDMEWTDWAGTYQLFLSYAYHYQRADGTLVARYDNAPHHPELPGFPNHKHTPAGMEPAEPPDLSEVFREIDTYLYPAESK